jgi:hypothetical protein
MKHFAFKKNNFDSNSLNLASMTILSGAIEDMKRSDKERYI